MTVVVNSALFGILFFFSAIISPTIFKVLDEKNSALLIRAVFPKVFALGAVLSGFSGIATFFSGNLLGAGLSCFSMALFLLNLLYFMPAINATRDNSVLDPILKKKRFKLLHTGSVLIYLFCMLISLGLILL